MTRGLGMAPPPRPQRVTAVDDDSAGAQKKHSDSADGASPKNGIKLRPKYSILATEEPAGDPDTAGPRVRGAGHGATRGAAYQGRKETETETGNKNGKRALLARGMQEDEDEERSPLERQRALNACGHQGGEREGYPSPCRACPRRASKGRRETPRHGNARPKHAAAG